MSKKAYQLSIEKIEKKLKTDLKIGLKQKESEKRLNKYGDNILPSETERSMLAIFLEQFKDFIVIILIIAVIISGFMGEIVDAIAIMTIIILNAVMGFIQEFKAEKSLEALKELSASKATVIRNGEIKKVAATKLVIGDIIRLDTGDKIPADARIIKQDNLQVNEASLTGESHPVAKKEIKLVNKAKISERANMLYMGTYIQSGNTVAVITATGEDTEMGKIADLLKTGEELKTPLQERLKELGFWIVGLCLLACVLVVIFGVLKGEAMAKMFMAGVSLAVAAIPEGLPAVVTLSLALGVQRMIKRNVIVRRLPAVETLGCADIICSDKTGTLTQNKMQVDKLYTIDNKMAFENLIFNKSKEKKTKKILKASLICNNAELNRYNKAIGDPTEKALLLAARKVGLSKRELLHSTTEKLTIPFKSERKRMSVIIKEEGEYKLYIKGAVDVLLDRFSSYFAQNQIKKINYQIRRKIKQANQDFADQALRVLAVGEKKLGSQIDKENLEKYERGLTFLGLVGMIDQPRAEVKSAIKNCQRAGIAVKMITGDHKRTAIAIAKKLNLLSPNDKVITGNQLEKLNQQELEKEIDKISIFARVAPKDKLKIVKALQNKNYTVAMTGDGINDSPAIKRSDIGIAMGQEGTDVTKEASSLILTDDNFSGIVSAIKEGRAIYDNIRKFIRYLLSCNIGELLTMLIASALGLPLPMIPIQILWINLVTDGLPALALGVEPADNDIMKRKPRDKTEGVFSQGLKWRIIGQGILIGLGTLLVFLFGLNYYDSILTARTMAFTNLVVAQLFFVFSCRSERYSIFRLNPLSNIYLLLAVKASFLIHLAILYIPIFQSIFNTVALEKDSWIIILMVSMTSTIILEVIKYFTNIIKTRINYIEM